MSQLSAENLRIDLFGRVDRLFANKSELCRRRVKAEVLRFLSQNSQWEERREALQRIFQPRPSEDPTWESFKEWLEGHISASDPARAIVTRKEDWHRADIVCELRKVGWSLRKLSLASGLSVHSLKAALDKPWPNGERIIAHAIGVAPETIWPSRYADPAHRGKQTHCGNESKDRGRL